MDARSTSSTASAADMQKAVMRPGQNTTLAPLRIEVPTQGVRLSFSKVYANRANEPAEFTLPYSSQRGAWIARIASLLGTVLFWAAIGWLLQTNKRSAVFIACGGALLVITAGSVLSVSSVWPLIGTLGLACAFGLRWMISARTRASRLSPASDA